MRASGRPFRAPSCCWCAPLVTSAHALPRRQPSRSASPARSSAAVAVATGCFGRSHLRPIPLAADPTCGRSHLPPIPLAADPTCRRSHLRPIPLAANPTCGRSHLRPIPLAADPTCGRSHLPPIPLTASALRPADFCRARPTSPSANASNVIRPHARSASAASGAASSAVPPGRAGTSAATWPEPVRLPPHRRARADLT